MNQFFVSDTLYEKIENILNRRCIPYTLIQKDKKYIKTSISGEKFHKIVIRAKMEKLQEEEDSPVPYVAKKELDDEEVRAEVGEAAIIIER